MSPEQTAGCVRRNPAGREAEEFLLMINRSIGLDSDHVDQVGTHRYRGHNPIPIPESRLGRDGGNVQPPRMND